PKTRPPRVKPNPKVPAAKPPTAKPFRHAERRCQRLRASASSAVRSSPRRFFRSAPPARTPRYRSSKISPPDSFFTVLTVACFDGFIFHPPLVRPAFGGGERPRCPGPRGCDRRPRPAGLT